MPSLLESVADRLRGENLTKISEHLNLDENTTKAAVSAALPLLLGAVSRRASHPQESKTLIDILDRNADGSVLDDIDGFLRGRQSEQPQQDNDLLRQVLGNKQARVEQGVSKSAGIDPKTVAKLMAVIAPIVMAVLSKHKAQAKEPESLPVVLRREREHLEQHHGGILEQVLDQDADGDFDLSDLAKVAMGTIFGK